MSRHTRSTSIHVALDARSIFMPRPRGTGRNLWDAYKLIPRMRPDWRFTLYHQRPNTGDLIGAAADALPPNVVCKRIDLPGDRLDAWLQVWLPWTARRDGVRLIHYPANEAPAFSPTPYVATVHDLVPLKPETLESAKTARSFRKRIKRAVRGAARIITPSEATRRELHAEFGVAPERVTVVPWAPDQAVVERLANVSDTEIAAVRDKYALGERWMLNFSGDTPRKNASGLLEAVARLPRELRSGLRVLLVGCEPEAFRQRLSRQAVELGVADCVVLAGFVPHADLPGLMRGASAILMPSLCEGFGLPILDAFAADTPMLTSDCSSMPEVAGDAAAYCDPHCPASIAQGIAEVLDPRRAEELRVRGRKRLGNYSWRRTAELMCDTYERALASIVAIPRRAAVAQGASQ